MKPLKLYGIALSNKEDLNNYTKYGLYITGDNPCLMPNGPSNLKGSRSNLLVFGYGEKRILQVIITDKAEITTRFMADDIWTAWSNNL